MIYLDNAATTKPLDAVAEACAQTMLESFGNPSSLHRLGVSAREWLEEARKEIAGFAGLTPDWLIFTSCATESNQTVLLGGTRRPNKNRNHILMSLFEHPSVREAVPELERRGYEIEFVRPDIRGLINPQTVAKRIRPQTEMISIIGVHNELGVVQDIEGIRQAIKAVNPKALFHVDGVQWFAKKKLPPPDLMPDFVTFSAHKFHGPRGLGGIIKSPGVTLEPLIKGGGQEGGLRSGTENLAAAWGTAAALRGLDLDKEHKRMASMQKNIYDMVLSKDKLEWIGPPPGDRRSPYISLFGIREKKSEIFIHEMESAGFFVSSGSACSEKGKKHDTIAETLELPESIRDGIIRVSFGRLNTEEDVRKFCEELDRRT